MLTVGDGEKEKENMKMDGSKVSPVMFLISWSGVSDISVRAGSPVIKQDSHLSPLFNQLILNFYRLQIHTVYREDTLEKSSFCLVGMKPCTYTSFKFRHPWPTIRYKAHDDKHTRSKEQLFLKSRQVKLEWRMIHSSSFHHQLPFRPCVHLWHALCSTLWTSAPFLFFEWKHFDISSCCKYCFYSQPPITFNKERSWPFDPNEVNQKQVTSSEQLEWEHGLFL